MNKLLIDQINEASSDMFIVALLMQKFSISEMSIIISALSRVQELALIQAKLIPDNIDNKRQL